MTTPLTNRYVTPPAEVKNTKSEKESVPASNNTCETAKNAVLNVYF